MYNWALEPTFSVSIPVKIVESLLPIPRDSALEFGLITQLCFGSTFTDEHASIRRPSRPLRACIVHNQLRQTLVSYMYATLPDFAQSVDESQVDGTRARRFRVVGTWLIIAVGFRLGMVSILFGVRNSDGK